MTPAINIVRKNKITHRVHEYAHEPSTESYGLEASEKLGISKDQVFKTLVVHLDNNDLVVAVLPVCSQLNMKRVAKAAGAKKASMADISDVQRSTGYVLGGISPLGQKKRLKTIIDASAQNRATLYISAGRRGLELELTPTDLQKLTNGVFDHICQ